MLSAAQPHLLASEAPPPPPRGTLTPRDYQVDGITAARRLIGEGVASLLLVMATGGGKCLGLGTPVMRFDGTLVPVEEVLPGDLLMGPDSRPRQVQSITRGRGPLYRITPRRGAPWVCNDVHVLTLVHTVTNEVIDVDLPTYLAETRTFRHVHKQFTPPDGIDFAPAAPLPLDPYFLGVWYGDGTKSLRGVKISKPDPEIAALVDDIAQRYGLKVRTDGTSCPTHHVAAPRGQKNPLLTLLRQVVGDGERLPHAYLTASREDRAAFLAGLLDTDGHLHNGGYEIAQLRPGHAEGVMFLARSLGLRATSAPKVVGGTTYQRIHICGDCSTLPLRIARKMAPPRRQKKCATRTGFSVEPIGEGEYAGFELEGDGRFLLGDFTVTHNTVIAALVALGAILKGKRVLFIGPRREIIAQAFWKLVEAGVPELDLGVIMADGVIPHAITRQPYSARRPLAPAQVASIQTLQNRKLPPADVVFVDESHHATSPTYMRIIEHYLALGAKVVGLTATPCRADGKGLTVFKHLHVITTFAKLAAHPDGPFLLVPRVFTTPHKPDLAGVKVTASGDYQQEEVAKRMDRRELVGDVVDHYQRLGAGRRAVIFAASVEHSRHLTDAFRAAGIAAAHIDGTTDTDVRDRTLAELRDGTVQVVVNYGCLSEGWDEPSVSYVGLCRPTKSLSLYLQMAGRGLRPAKGKVDALLVDHAGCVHQHGFPQDDREWSLDGRVGRAAAPSVRTCPKCYAALPAGTPVCSECGHVFEVETREGPATREGELVEADAASRTKATMDERVAFYEDVLRRAVERGRKLGFARHRYRDRFTIWPRGPRLTALEQRYYPSTPAAEEVLAEPAPAPVVEAPPELPAPPPPAAPLAPPRRARRIDLEALLATPPAPATLEVDAWVM